MSDVRRIAELYAKLGLPVIFLCGPECDARLHGKDGHAPDCAGKIPLRPGWQLSGYRGAADLLREYQEGCNVGLLCGLQPGARVSLACVDGDGPEALAWMREHLPPTPLRDLTRRGEHWYYRTLESVQPRNLRYCEPAAEMEVLGNGRQVVVPPSRHLSGHVYAFAGESWTDESVAEAPLFDPVWFGEFQRRSKRTTNGVNGHHREGGGAWPGERRFTRLDYEEAVERLISYLSSNNLPPCVSEQAAHDHLMRVALVTLRGFPLASAERVCGMGPGDTGPVDPEDAMQEALRALSAVFNPRCLDSNGETPYLWSLDDLWHKVESAAKADRLPGPDYWAFDDEDQRRRFAELRRGREFLASAPFSPPESSELEAAPDPPRQCGAFEGLQEAAEVPRREAAREMEIPRRAHEDYVLVPIPRGIDVGPQVDAAEYALSQVSSVYMADGKICDLVQDRGRDRHGLLMRPWLRPSDRNHMYEILSNDRLACWYGERETEHAPPSRPWDPKDQAFEHAASYVGDDGREVRVPTSQAIEEALGCGAWGREKPDKQVIASLMARGTWRHIRRINGIVYTPVVRPDGSILQDPGYDEQTGLLYVPELTLREVSSRPSRTQCRDALAALMRCIQRFPLARPDEARAVWLAMVLTRFARFTFRGLVPMFVVSANVKSAGKGKFVDSAAIIADGRPSEKMSFRPQAGEDSRVILSHLMEGTPTVCLDNIPRGTPLESDAFEALLTTPVFSGRIIGTSKNRRVAFPDTLWAATGNDLQTGGDMSRRVLRVDILDQSGRPAAREVGDQQDLEEWVRLQRPQMVRAALTLLSGWFTAGSPQATLEPLASYDPWSSVVRQCVVWCGLPDPGLSVGKASEDAVGAGAHFLFQHLRHFGAERVPDKPAAQQGVTPKDIAVALSADVRSPKRRFQEFADFLENAGVKLSAESIGAYLSKQVGEVLTIGDKRYQLAKGHSRAGRRYLIEPVEPQTAQPAPA